MSTKMDIGLGVLGVSLATATLLALHNTGTGCRLIRTALQAMAALNMIVILSLCVVGSISASTVPPLNSTAVTSPLKKDSSPSGEASHWLQDFITLLFKLLKCVDIGEMRQLASTFTKLVSTIRQCLSGSKFDPFRSIRCFLKNGGENMIKKVASITWNTLNCLNGGDSA